MTNILLMCVFVLEFQTGDLIYEKQAEVACTVLAERSELAPGSGKIYLVDCTEGLLMKRLSENIVKNDPLRHVIYEKDCF